MVAISNLHFEIQSKLQTFFNSFQLLSWYTEQGVKIVQVHPQLLKEKCYHLKTQLLRLSFKVQQLTFY